MDAHGLLLELQDEREKLKKADVTHIGVGFAYDRTMVKVVELISNKPLMVNILNKSEDGGVEVRGMMLNKTVGLYAAKIVDINGQG